MFVFKIFNVEKFYICRGFLLIMNSIFDLMGFIFLVIISGKILYCEFVFFGCYWDELFMEEYLKRW